MKFIRQGFDVSTYQDVPTTARGIDFQKMRAYGAEFVIIRAGQGNWLDEDWHKSIDASKGILPRAAYWFYDPRYSPQVQAQTFLSAVAGKQLEGRLWLDLEFSWDGAYKSAVNWLVFRDTIKAAGYRFGWYSSQTWWDAHVGNYAGSFVGEPGWVAQYYNALTRVPLGWKVYIWQDSVPNIGAAVGVESYNVDHNFWNEGFDFAAEWGISPQPPQTGDKMLEGTLTATTTSLKIRSGAGTAYPQIGGVYQGDKVYGTLDTASGWLKIQYIIRASGVQETISGWCSGNAAYITLKEYIPPANKHTVEVIVDGVTVYKTELS